MKKITYQIKDHKRIHTTTRGNELMVWFNDDYVWMAPKSKPWQSKKYKRSEVELIRL